VQGALGFRAARWTTRKPDARCIFLSDFSYKELTISMTDNGHAHVDHI
jgi:hypothetical protein